mmetsp:Transcript_31867/g.75683  ORF Transcript_31867/g.75683 Transcript_31867/m.75683 type:complete len:211 (+) Transcript_31867:297-929(+)
MQGARRRPLAAKGCGGSGGCAAGGSARWRTSWRSPSCLCSGRAPQGRWPGHRAVKLPSCVPLEGSRCRQGSSWMRPQLVVRVSPSSASRPMQAATSSASAEHFEGQGDPRRGHLMETAGRLPQGATVEKCCLGGVGLAVAAQGGASYCPSHPGRGSEGAGAASQVPALRVRLPSPPAACPAARQTHCAGGPMPPLPRAALLLPWGQPPQD